ncbi:hypothetical protein [Maribacter forsetii]|uniref:hypothetical protein n=1 Tax=Maribacter forsetii TaxID=444515 RepID=UPI00068CD9AE|nr:hypothetical protein [Maribacter forsetii]
MRKKIIFLIFITFFGISSCGVDSEVLEYQKSTIDLLYPEDNTEVTDGIILTDSTNTLVFKWEFLDHSENHLYFIELVNLDNNIIEIYESNNNEATIPLQRNHNYSWQVTDSIHNSSLVWKFKNTGPWDTSIAPLPATAISPVSGASISQTSTTVNLIWKAEDEDNDIIGYDLYFGTAEDPELLVSDITTSKYDDLPVEAGKIYYWKIVTKDSSGNESISEVFNFSVG